MLRTRKWLALIHQPVSISVYTVTSTSVKNISATKSNANYFRNIPSLVPGLQLIQLPIQRLETFLLTDQHQLKKKQQICHFVDELELAKNVCYLLKQTILTIICSCNQECEEQEKGSSTRLPLSTLCPLGRPILKLDLLAKANGYVTSNSNPRRYH